MSKKNSIVVVLADYSKKRSLLTLEDLRVILNEEREALGKLDAEVIELLSVRHNLKDIQKRRDKSIRIERSLIYALDWLENKIPEADGTQKDSAQALLGFCEKLITRSERIKKTISDDMAACRYAESKGTLNPAQALGAIISIAGGTAVFFKTFLASRLDVAVHAGEAAAVVGTYAAYYKQINHRCIAAAKAVAKTPQHLSALRRKARFSIIATTMTAAVAAKQRSEIKPRYPLPNIAGPKIVILAKL